MQHARCLFQTQSLCWEWGWREVWGTVQKRSRKAAPFFSCWPVQFCSSHERTTRLLFFFFFLFLNSDSSYQHAESCSPGQRTEAGEAGSDSTGTHGGKGADLFDVLLVALWARGPPGRAARVPEGVVVLQRVLSWPRHHSLQDRKAPLALPVLLYNGKNYIYST